MLTLLQTNPYDGMNSGDVAGAMAMGVGMLFFYLIIYLFFSFCLYKIFQKAGRDDAWAAFIPIYNTIVLVDIVKKPIWWFIMLMIPFVNIIFGVMISDRLSKFFGKDTLMTIVLVLFPFIGLPMLAFGDAAYNPNALPDERK
ncbi:MULTISPECIES: DUF5684 domain-containing protein [unclassified Kaistella]|uniref:DUF5684 domain-containing protein n=1 Tax=unclassified Kaistella TaxID=2762626 RepID=UPI0027341D8F|nr:MULTISPECIES: DUF5684 domain-containing protein [unclassified Kaistella]MCZ2083038.1 DUF5684 domain-containing protein [Flavobacteriales bacterium]MDP2454106.1 DUF5684 domain-containing protein [Kaistella sp. SH11-4b]MDP2457163.1 DUF5684 domain-containing protein [Kaistella sp. SH40-3]MDP2459921.1 DUF5684 domain-containing protein [Kaistella sp. SH19-2b]